MPMNLFYSRNLLS